MKEKTFLAINLHDYHANQCGKAETNTRIRFLSATSLEKAKEFINRLEPEFAWFVIPKDYCDKNIVYATDL